MPTPRRTFQDVVTNVEAGASIKGGCGERDALIIGDVIPGGGDLVKNRRAVA